MKRRRPEKTGERLASRRVYYDRMPAQEQRGHRRPGSQNPHKGR